MMKRTQIQVPEGDYAELERRAAGLGRSVADCIREGIHLFLERNKSGGVDLHRIAGKFRPGPLDDLKAHDRWLAQSIEQRKRVKRR